MDAKERLFKEQIKLKVKSWMFGRRRGFQEYELVSFILNLFGDLFAHRIVAEGLLAPEWVSDVSPALNKAMSKFPTWPTDPFHALAIIGEEKGELDQAVLQHVYELGDLESVVKEASHVAATAIRFIISLSRYRYEKSDQHSQLAQPPKTATTPEIPDETNKE